MMGRRHFNPMAELFGDGERHVFADVDDEPRDDQAYAFELDGHWDVVRESESGKAIRIRNEDGLEHWIPLSQMTRFSECWKVGDTGLVSVTEYLATERGWS